MNRLFSLRAVDPQLTHTIRLIGKESVVHDAARPSIRALRDAAGVAAPRLIITADGNGLGPGLCTYDPASSTGVLLVITTFSNNDIEFSLRATGMHP